MQTTTKQQFLHLFSLLSSTSKALSLKANKDILQLQNNPTTDIWSLSKELLESNQLTQQILGSQLISFKVFKEASQLSPLHKQQIRQYTIQCVSRIQNKGVLSKLAETFANLSKEEIQTDKWKDYLKQLVGFMKLGERNLLFGLMILGNIPSLVSSLAETEPIQARENELKQILLSSMGLNSTVIFSQSLKTLLPWSKHGLHIFEDENILQKILNRGLSVDLETSLQIIEASVNFLFCKNQSYPLIRQKLTEKTAISIQKSITSILSISISEHDVQLYYPFCELSLSILIKVKWIYGDCCQQLITFGLKILSNIEYRISIFAITFFIDLHFLNLPNNILTTCWNKALEIILRKCKLKVEPDEDINEYRYQARQFLSTVFQKYISLNMPQQNQNILHIIHNCINSEDEYIKQLGVFIALAIDQPYKDFDIKIKEQFTKQMVEFCSNNNSQVAEPHCLKYLSLNCNEILSTHLQIPIINSCSRKLINSKNSKIRQYALNVLALLLSLVESQESKTSILPTITQLYHHKFIIDETLLEMFISSFIQFVQSISNCYPFLTSIITNELNIAKQIKSMRYLYYILKNVEKTSTVQLQPVLQLIKQYVLSLFTTQTNLDEKSTQNVYKITLEHSFPPIQPIDIKILEHTIQLLSNNPQQNWNLGTYLFQTLIILNLKENQMQCSILESWLQAHFLSINSILFKTIETVPLQSCYEIFFKIQEEILIYSPELYRSDSRYMLVLNVASNAINSSCNQVLIRDILHFYQMFLTKDLKGDCNLDILRSSLKGLKQMNSSQYFLFYKIIHLSIKSSDNMKVAEIIKSEYLQTIDNRLSNQIVNTLLSLIFKMCSIANKSSSFKSLIIDLINLKQRTMSYEQFIKSIQALRKRLKL